MTDGIDMVRLKRSADLCVTHHICDCFAYALEQARVDLAAREFERDEARASAESLVHALNETERHLAAAQAELIELRADVAQGQIDLNWTEHCRAECARDLAAAQAERDRFAEAAERNARIVVDTAQELDTALERERVLEISG